MAKQGKYLTKSRYKLAIECPTKLFYSGKKNEYADASLDDPFLEALAKGGFQVSALAKCYYPNGIEVASKAHDVAVAETARLLEQETITIFEAAIRFENLFVRVDILEKKGKSIRLIEVKSKSADPADFYEEIWNKTKLKSGSHTLTSDWRSYIYDVAFQVYVCQQAFPQWSVTPFLICADKSKPASVNGLNQKFLLRQAGSQTIVEVVGDVSHVALGEKVLCELDVTEPVDLIHQGEEASILLDRRKFNEGVLYYSQIIHADERAKPNPGSHCKKCEFRTSDPNLKTGFAECWNQSFGINQEHTKEPFSFDVWFSPRADELVGKKVFFMKDISHGDFPIKPRDDGEAGLSRSQRQWLQVEKVQNGDESPFVDVNNLSLEMKNWDYPLHFIDFETSTVAIPFHAGRRPYEQIAFQFSHHQVSSTGTIEHAGQYINTRPGVFPNFEFLRNLRSELASDEGTIFRYSNHENSVLCQIYAQLDRSDEPDKRELMAFIKTITKKKEGSGKNEVVLWEGRRNMIDLCKLVQRFYYHPKTNGSNSIKHVLPAVLFDSEYLRSKYSKGIYGSDQNMRSLNFSKKTWIEYDSNGGVIDPYKQLPPVFDQYDKDTLDLLMEDDELRNGGAAMTAYAYLQFTQMTDTERERISAALLKYCELDTFAMVMIFEHWQNLVRKSGLAKVG